MARKRELQRLLSSFFLPERGIVKLIACIHCNLLVVGSFSNTRSLEPSNTDSQISLCISSGISKY